MFCILIKTLYITIHTTSKFITTKSLRRVNRIQKVITKCIKLLSIAFYYIANLKLKNIIGSPCSKFSDRSGNMYAVHKKFGTHKVTADKIQVT